MTLKLFLWRKSKPTDGKNCASLTPSFSTQSGCYHYPLSSRCSLPNSLWNAAVRPQQNQNAAPRPRQNRNAALRRQQNRNAALRRQQNRNAALRRQQNRNAALRRQQNRNAALRRQQNRNAALRRQQNKGMQPLQPGSAVQPLVRSRTRIVVVLSGGELSRAVANYDYVHFNTVFW
ncbi:hypothetical protein Pmar_PMAR011407 [Perkinsus marinus ATCC 50983]|uniref:Uncharacterized protein n=2 Tax=Perkinsus marinus (strain ATCC 50983 / TXsc) TaxID=423536 RepID=C5KVE4_PERM5|nr:hypothetical protein Pmar_PMAR011407 [Perkinsus marinus ATCC 50983]EER11549.1 hypothetical protein Pmar_PMAR011407 [Perkinsus marinus ATCC 50983]|eukprot:XP_002779754.1 hypothetical protein Pmar_PMAR011407 [Perkinsus marinus ATCC 50983]